MADDPNKKGQDAKRVSQQPWEQQYQKRKKKDQGSKSSPKGKSRGNSGKRER